MTSEFNQSPFSSRGGNRFTCNGLTVCFPVRAAVRERSGSGTAGKLLLRNSEPVGCNEIVTINHQGLLVKGKLAGLKPQNVKTATAVSQYCSRFLLPVGVLWLLIPRRPVRKFHVPNALVRCAEQSCRCPSIPVTPVPANRRCPCPARHGSPPRLQRRLRWTLHLLFPPLPLQEVVSDERLQGGQLLEEPKLLHFRGNTFSLQISVLDIPPFLWRIKPFSACQVPVSSMGLHVNSDKSILTGMGIARVKTMVPFIFERCGFNLLSTQQKCVGLIILMNMDLICNRML